jgi:hypothetical protein
MRRSQAIKTLGALALASSNSGALTLRALRWAENCNQTTLIEVGYRPGSSERTPVAELPFTEDPYDVP